MNDNNLDIVLEELKKAFMKYFNRDVKIYNVKDGKYMKLEKAAGHKYIKRIPHPSPKPGRKYVYFYNQQQIKDYKEKGVIPGEKVEEKKSTGSVWDRLKSFFSSDPKKVVDKAYELVKDSIGDVTKTTFAEHLSEYLENKEKWDARLAAEKEKPKPKKDIPKDKKEPAERKVGTGFKLSVMRAIASQYGTIMSAVKEDSSIGAKPSKDKFKEKSEESVERIKGMKSQKKVQYKGEEDMPYHVVDSWEEDGKKLYRIVPEEKIELYKKTQDVAQREALSDVEYASEMEDSKDNFETKPEGKDKTDDKTGVSKKAKKYTDESSGEVIYTGDFDEVIKKFGKPTGQFGVDKAAIKKAADKFLSKDAMEKGYFSDGKLLVTDKAKSEKLIEKYAKSLKVGIEEGGRFPDVSSIMPKNIKEDFSKPKEFFGTKFHVALLENESGETIGLSLDKLAFMKQQFPNAELVIPKTGTMSPVAFMEGGEIKGILMPMMVQDAENKKKEIKSFEGKDDDFEKHEKSKVTGGALSDEELKNADGSFKRKVSMPFKMKKEAFSGVESEVISALKSKISLTTSDVRPYFAYNKIGIEEGVWTDSKMLIMDKDVTDKIYDTNLKNMFLKDVNKGGNLNVDREDYQNKKADSGYFPNYKSIIPSEDKISDVELKATGEYRPDDKDYLKRMKFKSGDTEIILDADRYATIKSLFPTAKAYPAKENASTIPVVFKVGNEVKALLMPVVPRDDKSGYRMIGEKLSPEDELRDKLEQSKKK